MKNANIAILLDQLIEEITELRKEVKLKGEEDQTQKGVIKLQEDISGVKRTVGLIKTQLVVHNKEVKEDISSLRDELNLVKQIVEEKSKPMFSIGLLSMFAIAFVVVFFVGYLLTT